MKLIALTLLFVVAANCLVYKHSITYQDSNCANAPIGIKSTLIDDTLENCAGLYIQYPTCTEWFEGAGIYGIQNCSEMLVPYPRDWIAIAIFSDDACTSATQQMIISKPNSCLGDRYSSVESSLYWASIGSCDSVGNVTFFNDISSTTTSPFVCAAPSDLQMVAPASGECVNGLLSNCAPSAPPVSPPVSPPVAPPTTPVAAPIKSPVAAPVKKTNNAAVMIGGVSALSIVSLLLF